MKKTVVLLLFACIVSASFSQGYKIKVKIKNLKDSTLLLGHHFGTKKFLDDTAKLDSKGEGTFEGKKPLPGGMYIIILPKKTFFDVLIDEDQDFAVENDTSDYLTKMRVSGSDVNRQFYDFQNYMNNLTKKAREIQPKLKGTKNADSSEIFKEQMKNLENEANDYKKKFLSEHPNSLFTKILTASTDIIIPEPPRDANGKITDSTFQYRYYRSHYWDNIDMTDARLLRTPFIEEKLNTYIEKMIPPVADTIIPETDLLITKALVNKEFYQYMLGTLFNYYNQSKVMGLDAVFVHLADKYYLAGKADWSDKKFLDELADRVKKVRPNLIGNLAPDLQLYTDHYEVISLRNITAKFIIVAFWEPGCGHCQKEIPALYQMYQRVKSNGVEVFSVCTQNDTATWKKFIKEHNLDWINAFDPYVVSNLHVLYDIYSTPTLYLLDSKKKIIAKRLSIEQLEEIINRMSAEQKK